MNKLLIPGKAKSVYAGRTTEFNFLNAIVTAFFLAAATFAISQCASVSETYGTNVWNSYSYNSNNLSNLKGVISSGITVNTSTQFVADWGTGAPSATCGATGVDGFTTSHRMNRNFSAGWYVFTYSSDDGIRISTDNGASWNVVNNFGTSTVAGTSATIFLSGSTNVRIDHRENTGGASVNVSICQMDGANVFGSGFWNAYVFDDMDMDGSKYQGTFTETNLAFCHSWGAGQPSLSGQRCGKTMDNDYYSVRYVRQNDFPAGNYVVRTITDDGARVGINTTTGASYNIINTGWNTSTNDITSSQFSLNGATQFVYFDMRENNGSATASFNILKVPANPIGITSNLTNNAICTSGGSITLTASGVEGTVYWYSGSCGGTYLGTGNSITVNPSANTTYYARNRNYSDAGCGNTLELFSAGCASINVLVGTPPTGVDAGANAAICNGGSTVLSGTAISTSFSGTTASPNVAIPDNNVTGISSIINIPSSAASANQLGSVTININHTWDSDLLIYLIAPNGSQIELSTNNGGLGDNYTGTVFSTSGTAITSGVAPFTGTYAPEQAFSSLTGTAQGNWTLKVIDGTASDYGTLLNWTIALPSVASYSWTGGPIASGTTTATPTVNPTTTTIYTMTATSNGCSASDVATVTVDSPADAGTTTISAAGYTAYNSGKDIAVCSGTTVTVTRTGGSGTPHYWGGDYTVDLDDWDYFDNQTYGNSFTYSFPKPGDYLIRCHSENACGWNWNSYSDIIVHVSPVNVPDIAADQSICSGSTPAAITGAAGNTGAGAYTYLWKQSADNGVTWTDAIGANTGQNYAPPALTSTVLYKRIVTSNGCLSKEGELVTWGWTSGAPDYNNGVALASNEGKVIGSGSSIRKIYASWGAVNGWTGGGLSTQAVAHNGGYVEFEVEDNNKYRMCGLGNSDTDAGYGGIEFAIYTTATGTVEISESGANRGSFGAYLKGDLFRVAVENNQVKYYKNGSLLYTSTVTPVLPLYADLSIFTPGGSLKYVRIQDPVQIIVKPNIPAVPIVSASNPTICAPGTTNLTASGLAPSGKYAAATDASSVVVIPTAAIGSSWTLEVWTKFPLYASGVHNTLFRNTSSGGDHQILTQNQVLGSWDNTSGTGFKTSGFDVSTLSAGWHHVAAVGSGGSTKYYIDGELVGTAPWQSTNSIEYINGLPSTQAWGNIDNVRIWNTAKSIANIRTDMYYATPTTNTANLVANYTFDQSNLVAANNATYNGTSSASIAYSDANYYTYTWSGGPSLPSASVNEVQTTGSISSGGAFNYTVSASAGSCGSPASANVPVTVATPSTAPTGIAGAGVTVCHGNTVTLTASGGSLSSGASYQWYTGSCGGTAATGTLSGTGNASIQVSPSATTTYYVRAGAGTTCPATTCVNGMVSLPAAGNGLATHGQSAVCNVSGNNWIHFYTSGGNLIASINPNGNNLGSVTATAYVNSGGNAILTQACGTTSPSFTTAVLGRRWVITPTNNLAASVRFPFDSGELVKLTVASATATVQNLLDNVSAIGGLKMSHYSGVNQNGNWTDNCVGAGGSGGTQLVGTQGANGVIASANGFMSTITGGSYVQFNTPGFSEFWLHGDGGSSPLPVELTAFAAHCSEGSGVDLSWSTASEVNSQKFIIEKSRDLGSWISVSEVQAAGNANHNIDYVSADPDPFGGVSYYRLVQVDLNGTEKIYGPISVSCSGEDNSMIVFPNPTKGSFTVEITSAKTVTNAEVELTDLTGKVISSRKLNIVEGKNQVLFDESNIQIGTYIVRLRSNEKQFTPVKVVVN